MPESPTPGHDGAYSWVQLTLLPYEVVEAVCRFAIVTETDHVQWQVELTDPATHTLIALQSRPHASALQWPAALAEMVQVLTEVLEAHVSPF